MFLNFSAIHTSVHVRPDFPSPWMDPLSLCQSHFGLTALLFEKHIPFMNAVNATYTLDTLQFTYVQALTNILYHLAERPELYVDALREEVRDVVGRFGWSKAAMREMVKVDSFVREAERFNGLSCCA
jgi:hypothetical protein